MIPILFPKEETNFTTNGIGRLSGTTKCVVSERLNTFYTLEAEIAANSPYADEVKPGRIIFAKPYDKAFSQPFRIYEANRMLDGTMQVLANHISYDLGGALARNITGVTSAAEAIAELKSREWIDSGFTYMTDLSVSAAWEKRGAFSVRSCMIGDGSIQEAYGGEWYFDRYQCSLLSHRGSDKGVNIRYGKNMTGLSAVSNSEEDYTGVFGFYYSNGTYVSATDITYLDEDTVPQKILIIDHTEDFDSTPTKAQLDALADSDLARIAGVVESISVSFVPLWQTEEYKDLAPLESVDLGDIVTAVHNDYGIRTKLEVVQRDFDVLSEKYEGLELGAVRPNIADVVADLERSRK